MMEDDATDRDVSIPSPTATLPNTLLANGPMEDDATDRDASIPSPTATLPNTLLANGTMEDDATDRDASIPSATVTLPNTLLVNSMMEDDATDRDASIPSPTAATLPNTFLANSMMEDDATDRDASIPSPTATLSSDAQNSQNLQALDIEPTTDQNVIASEEASHSSQDESTYNREENYEEHDETPPAASEESHNILSSNSYVPVTNNEPINDPQYLDLQRQAKANIKKEPVEEPEPEPEYNYDYTNTSVPNSDVRIKREPVEYQEPPSYYENYGHEQVPNNEHYGHEQVPNNEHYVHEEVPNNEHYEHVEVPNNGHYEANPYFEHFQQIPINEYYQQTPNDGRTYTYYNPYNGGGYMNYYNVSGVPDGIVNYGQSNNDMHLQQRNRVNIKSEPVDNPEDNLPNYYIPTEDQPETFSQVREELIDEESHQTELDESHQMEFDELYQSESEDSQQTEIAESYQTESEDSQQIEIEELRPTDIEESYQTEIVESYQTESEDSQQIEIEELLPTEIEESHQTEIEESRQPEFEESRQTELISSMNQSSASGLRFQNPRVNWNRAQNVMGNFSAPTLRRGLTVLRSRSGPVTSRSISMVANNPQRELIRRRRLRRRRRRMQQMRSILHASLNPSRSLHNNGNITYQPATRISAAAAAGGGVVEYGYIETETNFSAPTLDLQNEENDFTPIHITTNSIVDSDGGRTADEIIETNNELSNQDSNSSYYRNPELISGETESAVATCAFENKNDTSDEEIESPRSPPAAIPILDVTNKNLFMDIINVKTENAEDTNDKIIEFSNEDTKSSCSQISKLVSAAMGSAASAAASAAAAAIRISKNVFVKSDNSETAEETIEKTPKLLSSETESVAVTFSSPIKSKEPKKEESTLSPLAIVPISDVTNKNLFTDLNNVKTEIAKETNEKIIGFSNKDSNGLNVRKRKFETATAAFAVEKECNIFKGMKSTSLPPATVSLPDVTKNDQSLDFDEGMDVEYNEECVAKIIGYSIPKKSVEPKNLKLESTAIESAAAASEAVEGTKETFGKIIEYPNKDSTINKIPISMEISTSKAIDSKETTCDEKVAIDKFTETSARDNKDLVTGGLEDDLGCPKDSSFEVGIQESNDKAEASESNNTTTPLSKVKSRHFTRKATRSMTTRLRSKQSK